MNYKQYYYFLLFILISQFIESSSRQMRSEFTNENIKSNTSQYKYVIKKFTVPVDHFSFSINDTFEIRYFVNDTWKYGKNPPIFFYTGNEGSLEVFAENTGFIWDIAPSYGALVVFAEHRYYGESMPFGNKSTDSPKHFGFLTSQQALADYVDLITYIKSDPSMKHSPVIAFGGSYGGMLSAWFRMKYPHVIHGAIAASAPILQFTGFTDCQVFSRIVTSDFRAVDPNCEKVVRKSWSSIDNLTSTDNGKKWMTSKFKICKTLNTTANVKAFKDYLSSVYSNLAMVNYPYETDFLSPLPPYPISEFCKLLKNTNLSSDEELLTYLQRGINLYSNYTGKTKCLDLDDAEPSLGAADWSYQACTEMVMPFCNDGVNDMFEPQPWNFEDFSKDCLKHFNVTPKPNLVCDTYGCDDLSTATNIVFSNGLLDPWSGGGVLRNLSSSAVAIIIPEGAHHLDLRGAHPADPYSVIKAREYHKYYIKKWIKEYREFINNTSDIM
ncbi:lysosomal Pro-X carboxypeptidase [Microplitis mediator]|uniref:lysosomal Pro-X carboxypeptidase n=1 Tax=Microplitis mediator TaxID=375433 RepID=UPI0025521587|nr:lysosomal Pro-X carboxypeptidase [Microplitis mediator]